MADSERLARCRATLGSVSAFMKHLKQPIAWQANREDRCTGHFFEGRFYSGALLSEDAVVAAMAYVDLNPVRARIANSLEGCRDSSIALRLRATMNSRERLTQALTPLVSGISEPVKRMSISLDDYCLKLNLLIGKDDNRHQHSVDSWYNRVASFRKRQRAYGLLQELRDWGTRQGWQRFGVPIVGSSVS